MQFIVFSNVYAKREKSRIEKKTLTFDVHFRGRFQISLYIKFITCNFDHKVGVNMAGPIQDVIEEDAADLQFPKGISTFTSLLHMLLLAFVSFVLCSTLYWFCVFLILFD